jgi:hypothetical protein
MPPKDAERVSFNEALKFSEALKEISYNTWLIVDLDNTVMTSRIDLGGDAWFTSLCEHAASQDTDPAVTMALVFVLYNMVQNFVRTMPVEPEIVLIIKALQNIGVPVFGLTARSYPIRQATVRQLADIGINFSINCIAPGDGVSYEQGIIYCGGQNKGDFLSNFLIQYNQSPEHIVMLDDKSKYLGHVGNATESLSIRFSGFHYRCFDERLKQFDMKRANIQLAHLIERLPPEVQDAIKQLNLIPDDVDLSHHSSNFAHHFYHYLPNTPIFKHDISHQLSSLLHDKKANVFARTNSVASYFCEEQLKPGAALIERAASCTDISSFVVSKGVIHADESIVEAASLNLFRSSHDIDDDSKPLKPRRKGHASSLSNDDKSVIASFRENSDDCSDDYSDDVFSHSEIAIPPRAPANLSHSCVIQANGFFSEGQKEDPGEANEIKEKKIWQGLR